MTKSKNKKRGNTNATPTKAAKRRRVKQEESDEDSMDIQEIDVAQVEQTARPTTFAMTIKLAGKLPVKKTKSKTRPCVLNMVSGDHTSTIHMATWKNADKMDSDLKENSYYTCRFPSESISEMNDSSFSLGDSAFQISGEFEMEEVLVAEKHPKVAKIEKLGMHIKYANLQEVMERIEASDDKDAVETINVLGVLTSCEPFQFAKPGYRTSIRNYNGMFEKKTKQNTHTITIPYTQVSRLSMQYSTNAMSDSSQPLETKYWYWVETSRTEATGRK